MEEGDTIAIVSPSGPIKSDSLDFAIETINSWGLKASIGKHAFDKYGVFAGTDADRAADFQKALNDKKVKAILCARGGYKFVCLSHNTLRGAAGGGVLLAELLCAENYI